MGEFLHVKYGETYFINLYLFVFSMSWKREMFSLHNFDMLIISLLVQFKIKYILSFIETGKIIYLNNSNVHVVSANNTIVPVINNRESRLSEGCNGEKQSGVKIVVDSVCCSGVRLVSWVI